MSALVVEAIPAELRELDQWVLCRFEQRDGKTTKVPYRAEDPWLRASTTDPSTWASFGEAFGAADWLELDGIGFVFTADDPYCGVDLDAGLPDADRAAIASALDSYTETSVSGTGWHVIARAELPAGARNRKGPIEVYDRGRYFVVTGQHVRGTPTTIEDRQAELEEVLAEFLPAAAPHPSPRPPQPVEVDDQELLERAFAAKNGASVEALWRGDTSAHDGDDSAADFALCQALAFWAGWDPARIDRLFRSSDLYREKWDERRGDSTYGAQTIANAIAATPEVYAGRIASVRAARKRGARPW